MSPGLIPARAGNTWASQPRHNRPRAHPRSRGEHFLDDGGGAVVEGSSPLARGTQLKGKNQDGTDGLIPARAGNTAFRDPSLPNNRAHPRSRGEHVANLLCVMVMAGSSPLARGTLCVVIDLAHGVGLIPARAGNTWQVYRTRKRSRAHPRSRGEHLVQVIGATFAAGSSPLARGTHANFFQPAIKRGLIPARAGNTLCS